MFDYSSSKLLILGIVALLVVGPKDLPMLLRQIGKYMGIIRRQAAEFRAQFDEAMRESELQELRKDVENLGHETEKTLRETGQSFQSKIAAANRDMETVVAGAGPIMAPADEVAAIADTSTTESSPARAAAAAASAGPAHGTSSGT